MGARTLLRRRTAGAPMLSHKITHMRTRSRTCTHEYTPVETRDKFEKKTDPAGGAETRSDAMGQWVAHKRGGARCGREEPRRDETSEMTGVRSLRRCAQLHAPRSARGSTTRGVLRGELVDCTHLCEPGARAKQPLLHFLVGVLQLHA